MLSPCEISIRSVQHYLYCPHRWGLMEINRSWAENFYVTRANLAHERVHDPERNDSAPGKEIFTAVPIYNDLDEYGLFGVADLLELIERKNGIAIAGRDKKYQIRIVEYKPTKPKTGDYRHEDLMQVFAQKLCVDYVFGGDCDAALYYTKERRRVPLPLRENFPEYDAELKDILSQMRAYLEKGVIPPVRKGQKCSGCSMKDICMPSVSGKSRDPRNAIRKALRDDDGGTG